MTFDDGLIDHFEHVRPILLERGLWGTFYVSSDTLTLDKLLNVHRVHFLLGRYGGKHVLRTLEKLLKTEHIIPSFFENLQDQPYQNQDMPAAAKEVKKIVNYAMRPSAKNAVLAQLFKEVAGSEQDVASQYYLSAQQIAQMDAEGFSFGAHGKSHNLLTKFNGNDLLTEVDESITLLNKHLLQPSDTYCYPYGGPDSWNEHTLQALRKKNILYSYFVRKLRRNISL